MKIVHDDALVVRAVLQHCALRAARKGGGRNTFLVCPPTNLPSVACHFGIADGSRVVLERLLLIDAIRKSVSRREHHWLWRARRLLGETFEPEKLTALTTFGGSDEVVEVSEALCCSASGCFRPAS